MTTKTKLTVLRLFAVGALAMAAAIGWRHRAAPVVPLPAERAYPRLPRAFAGALHTARARAVDGAYAPDDVRALAHLYQANRLNEEALACYGVLRSGPQGLTARDHYYLAQMAQDSGDLDLAEGELRATIATAPQYLPARLALGDVLFKAGNTGAAGKEYQSVLEIDPSQPQALFALARIDLMGAGDDAAIARLSALMTAHPEMTSGAALLAQIFERRGEAQRAAAMILWSRQKPEPVPADPWLDALLADCYDMQRLGLKFEEYFTSGEIQEALPLLGRVEELDPKSPIPHLLRGWSQARDHNDAVAVVEYRRALDGGGDPEKICPYMVQSLLALDRIAEAAALMAEFHARKPDSIPILIAYADVVVRKGDEKLARVLLTQVLQKEPNLYSANMDLAKILWASGERDEAAKCLGRAARVKANDIASRGLLGEYYLGKSDPDSAIPPLEEALAGDPASTPARTKLNAMLYAAYLRSGIMDEEKGRAADAVARYDSAIRLDPGDPTGYARKAGACVQLKQFRGASGALGKLAALQPGNPTVYLSLGDVLYQDGDRDGARRNWEKARALTPGTDAALRAAEDARLNGPVTEETFR